jgi:hypothetical protein
VSKPADLTAYLFDGQPHVLSGELDRWMKASARFTAFVETYRDKIRKKMRVTRERESILDLRGELEVAYCLLGDRRFEVAYELYASGKRRGPDFTVTYRVNLRFNIEVARVRSDEAEPDLRRKEERILRVLLDKLGQMQPGMPNLLVIQMGQPLARAIDLNRLMQEVRTRADARDISFFGPSRYDGPGAFYKDFQRLGGILLWGAEQPWIHKQARPGLPPRVMRLVGALASGASG